MDTMTLAAVTPDASPCLHRNPPATPSSFFAGHRHILAVVAAAFAFLAVAAATANAWLLMRWDEPIQRFVESNRNDTLDTFFRTASRLGSTIIVLSLGALLAALTWRRCKAVTAAVVVATLSRPLIEFAFKELVGRDRPDLQRLVTGDGPSFPGGHPFAAIALWGMIPVVVGLFTRRRALWWGSAVLSACMIIVIGASRVYLGVHWASDVVGGLLLGVMFLLAVDSVMHHTHRIGGCALTAARARADVRPAQPR
jgi:undecaprenyl-diphosphatase